MVLAGSASLVWRRGARCLEWWLVALRLPVRVDLPGGLAEAWDDDVTRSTPRVAAPEDDADSDDVQKALRSCAGGPYGGPDHERSEVGAKAPKGTVRGGEPSGDR